ncbi:MAG: hypothetical protein ACI840_001495 [Ulvibacter sp.]|jgi:hypothetical protein
MKKTTLLVAAFFISASGFSQEIDFGVKAGVTLSSSVGFQAGGFAGMKLGEKTGLQADILYSKQGSAIAFTDGSADEKFDLTYVNLPIVFKYYISESFNIQAGPQVGFKISDGIDTSTISGAQKAKSLEISGVIGVGYELPSGLRVEGRFNAGLTELLEPISPAAQIPGKNSVITLTVGYSLL